MGAIGRARLGCKGLMDMGKLKITRREVCTELNFFLCRFMIYMGGKAINYSICLMCSGRGNKKKFCVW